MGKETTPDPHLLINKDDTTIFLDGDSAALLGSGDGVPGAEDVLEFLESTADGLDSEEVPEDGLDDVPADEDEDVVVLDVLEGDGTGVQVDEGDGTDNDSVHGHTLGTGGGLQALDGVESLERGVGEGVDDVEEVEEGDGTTTNIEVLLVSRQVSPSGGQATVTSQHERADEGTPDKDLATGHLVGEGNTETGTDGRGEGVDQVQVEDHGVIVTDSTVDLSVEVTKTVAGELTEDTHEQDLERTPASRGGVEELRVVPPALVSTIESNTLLEFNPFEFDDGVVGVARTVEAGQEGTGIVFTASGHQPTRRLRQEPDGADDDEGRSSLEDEGETPGEVAVDLSAAEGDTGGRDGSSEPTAVVETGHTTTPLRRADFNAVGRSRGGEDGDTETEDETTSNELVAVVGRGNDGSSDANDPSTNEHTGTSSPAISNGTSEPGTGDTTNGVDREDETGGRTEVTRVELVLVVGHGVDGSHQGTIVTVGARAQEGNEHAPEEEEGVRRPWGKVGLLDSGGEGSIADSLDLLSALDGVDVVDFFNHKVVANDDLLMVVSAGFLDV